MAGADHKNIKGNHNMRVIACWAAMFHVEQSGDDKSLFADAEARKYAVEYVINRDTTGNAAKGLRRVA